MGGEAVGDVDTAGDRNLAGVAVRLDVGSVVRRDGAGELANPPHNRPELGRPDAIRGKLRIRIGPRQRPPAAPLGGSVVGVPFASSAATLLLSFLNFASVTRLAEAFGPPFVSDCCDATAVPVRAMNIATKPSTWDRRNSRT